MKAENKIIKNPVDSKEEKELDDDQRVRVLSPGMLVFKRFIRNRLAIVGTVIIIGMFLFAFVGGFLSPYDESQVFMGYETMSKEFAGVTMNEEYRLSNAEGKTLPGAAKAGVLLAINTGETEFSSGENTYVVIQEGNELYRIGQLSQYASATVIRGEVTVEEHDQSVLSDAVKSAFENAIKEKATTFTVEGQSYYVSGSGKEYSLSLIEEVAVASKRIFNAYTDDLTLSNEFRLEAEKALEAGATSFTADQKEYELVNHKHNAAVTYEGTVVAEISHLVVNPVGTNTIPSTEFKTQVAEAIATGQTQFVLENEDGTQTVYTMERKNDQYMVKTDVSTQKILIYERPSSKHWLGTDANGMDILTRLMYGGRISLIIGFIVIAIEVALGVVLGGIAGYFGKWVDSLIMRIVDIFYCIPSMPLIIILGAVMDEMKVDPQVRIYFLMFIMGFLGWPGIARMVRGQILSLREQEFMTATESLGISVPRRIFKHLIPNVIPQLIVFATMGLGGIILTESTLSFLGLGVKYPYASWGNIISAVSNVHVMTNYLFVWIPAGLCILLTVLAFNFIGDGLRDAFDPKMKR